MKSQQFETLLQIADNRDFITGIRAGPRTLVLIHETNHIEIVHDMHLTSKKVIKFQSNVYDAAQLNNILIVSNKNMPVRLFNVSHEDFDELPIATIYDRKPNSELFLTPLQIAIQGEKVLGGGKKHLTQYDLNKATAHRYRPLDKKFISSIQIKENAVITGQFEGQLEIFDTNSGKIVSSLKPHMDMVTQIKKVPSAEHYFVSLARKDNLSYLWDLRNMTQYVEYFQHPRNGNQRTGLDISPDGSQLYLGGQKGQIFIHSLKENISQSNTFFLDLKKCVSSILCGDQRLICSIGERSFPMFGETSEGGRLMSMELVK